MAEKDIVVRGARQHNLKNVDVTIPRDKFVVITGLSGSGKSSLAFDTIYAEGQRRYVESLSSYARMFLGQANKPDVDSIDGLSPAVSIWMAKKLYALKRGELPFLSLRALMKFIQGKTFPYSSRLLIVVVRLLVKMVGMFLVCPGCFACETV